MQAISGNLAKDLTILSVSVKDRYLLDLNYTLTESLNVTDGLTWLVVDNAHETLSERVSRDDHRFVILDGVEFEEMVRGGTSYHHARALNLGLQHVKTRFVLSLDPDCFVLRRHWIEDVLGHMQQAKLSFFGAPCHPRKPASYRYFPYVACLFVDLGRVSLRDLDFTPEITELKFLRKMKKWILFRWLVSGKRPEGVKPPIEGLQFPSRVNRAYVFDMLRRLIISEFLEESPNHSVWIGTSGDTGSRIYHRFVDNFRHKYEYAVPVWKVEKKSPTSIKEKIKQSLIPDTLSVIPKKRGYFTDVTFSDLGVYDVESAFHCESYLWRDAPFCFHIREIGLRDEDTLREAIQTFMYGGRVDDSSPVSCSG